MNNNEETVFLAVANYRNQKIKFGIKKDDRRRHMYLIGKTGMGKTEMLGNMVVADIKAGRGIGLIDPHGEFAEKILNYIPKERINDVVYFNPADLEHPIGFNPLEIVDPDHRHFIASSIMAVFKKIWPDVWSARMEYILNNSLLTLLEYPGSTLLEIMRLLSDKDYRKKIVDDLEDIIVKNFWTNEFAKYTQRLETEALAAIQNKVGQFASNPLIRNIIGQKKSLIDMRKIMDQKKIFIANLSVGRIGEDNSSLLGSLIITKLQLAAMTRIDIQESERNDFYLYVDEFQKFAIESFADILSEARKYRLNLILAHQYLEQLHETIKSATIGNVGTFICFRIGAEDSEFLEKEFLPEFEANDLMNLSKFHIYVKLLIDGVSSKPFSAETLALEPEPINNFKKEIIASSQAKYSLDRNLVKKKITQEWTGQKTREFQQTSPMADAKPYLASAKPYFRKTGMPLKTLLPKPPQTIEKTRPFIQSRHQPKKVDIEELKKTIEESLNKV